MTKQAIVLLSGGLDSSTCLYWALSKGYTCHALSFDYGQQNIEELNHARAIANSLNIAQTIVKIDFSYLKNPLLTKGLEVPQAKNAQEVLSSPHFSPFTVPARNLHFLAHAMGLAVSLSISTIVTGSNRDDKNFSDCSKAFIQSVVQLSRYAIDTGPVEILTPLIDLQKAQIIELALELNVPIEQTLSCYLPKEKRPCNTCHACLLRKDAMQKVLPHLL